MNYISKIGFKNNYFLLKSLLYSKFLTLNTYTFPKSKFIKIKFPLFELKDLNKSKLLIIILDFLEKISNVRPTITQIKIILKKGVFYKCQVILTKLYYMNFLNFLNEFILNNTLLKFANKSLKLVEINKNIISLFLFDFNFLFDVYSKKLLNYSKFFWIELEFYFNKNYKILNNFNLKLYTQLFFCHNIFEWVLK